ncbi:MAG: TIGR00730 family Rossman fold protein, partial [Bacteroidaceae bacterium]|nr:TIGR00730 family Rossman fold protein [Bacteroidaceae bacterium]
MEKIGVFCASSNEMEQIFYDKAAELGRMLGKAGKTLVYGGNSSGLMEAVAKATKEAGGKVFGVVPRKLVEAGRVSDCVDITFYCEDLNDR